MNKLADLSSQQRKKDNHAVGQIVRRAGSFRQKKKTNKKDKPGEMELD